jgi:hypothetical protein
MLSWVLLLVILGQHTWFLFSTYQQDVMPHLPHDHLIIGSRATDWQTHHHSDCSHQPHLSATRQNSPTFTLRSGQVISIYRTPLSFGDTILSLWASSPFILLTLPCLLVIPGLAWFLDFSQPRPTLTFLPPPFQPPRS